jgi:acetoacetate decarboxylase
MAYPHAPWRLHGELIVIPARTPGPKLGGLMLANYTHGTLAYHELIVFSHATLHGMVISHIYVDDERSQQGGIHIWGLPKELARITYERRRFTARQGEVTLLEATVRRRPGRLPLTLPTPITSDHGDTIGIAKIKAAPALVNVEVAPESPFAHLGLHGTRIALAGDELDLTMPPPRS